MKRIKFIKANINQNHSLYYFIFIYKHYLTKILIVKEYVFLKKFSKIFTLRVYFKNFKSIKYVHKVDQLNRVSTDYRLKTKLSVQSILNHDNFQSGHILELYWFRL